MKNSTLFQFSLALLFGLLISTAGMAQRKINGIVQDATTNLPLGGATITENNKTHTVTDPGGKFEVEIPGRQAVLIVSFVGYDNRNVVVGESETNVVVKLMQSSNNELSQVVVVGYGVQKKVDLTGSVAVVVVKRWKTDQYPMLFRPCRALLRGWLLPAVTGNQVRRDGILISGGFPHLTVPIVL
jgi:hypothetical protein